jgi:hypothetical protein
MNSSDFTKSIIALACWRRAKGELHQTMLAYCQVLMNRAKAGWFMGDLYENAWQDLVDSEDQNSFPDTRDPQFQQMVYKLESVTSGMVADKTGGALYATPTDHYSESFITGTITTTIGGLIFIK